MTKIEEIKAHFRGYDKENRKMISGADLAIHLMIYNGYTAQEIRTAITELDEERWECKTVNITGKTIEVVRLSKTVARLEETLHTLISWSARELGNDNCIQLLDMLGNHPEPSPMTIGD